MYWKKLNDTEGQVWDGHFVPFGEPVWAILDRSSGSTWPLASVDRLSEAQKEVAPKPARGAKK